MEALLVRQLTEGVVWIVTLQHWVDGAVGVVEAVEFHIGPQRHVAELSLDQSEVLTMELARNFALNEDSEALVEPKALPVGAGDSVAGP